MFLLRHSIRGLLAGAVALATFSAQASPAERLGFIVVYADQLDSHPIYLGPGAGTYDYYSWGDVVPDEGGWNNTPTPSLCQVLASQGRPKDCDRVLAMGLLRPPTMPPMPMYQSHNGNLVGPHASQLLQSVYDYANYRMAQCYAIPMADPERCEEGYVVTYTTDCNRAPTTDPLDFFPTKYPNINPREICHAGLPLINTRIQNARNDRSVAEWFGFKFGVQVGPFGVDLNTNMFTDLFTKNPYNQALIYARRFDACKNWYKAFDKGNCGQYYGGF